MAQDAVRVTAVDRDGLTFTTPSEDSVVDVCFDDRRVWSFWLLRDSTRTSGGRHAAWPPALVRFLDGTTQLRVVGHVDEAVLLDQQHSFGTSTERIAVVDSEGRPLGIDKAGRLARTFDTRSKEHVAPLLDAVETVLGALGDAGIEAFPAYGTLLGAVREGALIGHDSDADLGYVSRHTHPVDVIRESFALQRRLVAAGFDTHRYSGAAFKVDVAESDGSIRGLDVFGGFLTDGMLYLMGEVGAPFEEDWIFPLGTTTLEGRSLPAPARPDKLLEAMYGASWRVPDPAYKFTTPAATVRRLNGWFRGTRVHQADWSRVFSRLQDRMPRARPSLLAQQVVEREEGAPARLVDVGTGRGADALWFARKGSAVTAYDFVPQASRAVQRAAARDGLALEVHRVNFNETRSWLAEGARLAHEEGPCVMFARHLVDGLTPRARLACWRFLDLGLRGGGTAYVEFVTGGPTPELLHPVDVDDAVRELRDLGADILAVERGEQDLVKPGPDGTRIHPPVARLVFTFGREAQ